MSFVPIAWIGEYIPAAQISNIDARQLLDNCGVVLLGRLARPQLRGIIGVFPWHLGRALINAQIAASAVKGGTLINYLIWLRTF
jgi:hypothetical protein